MTRRERKADVTMARRERKEREEKEINKIISTKLQCVYLHGYCTSIIYLHNYRQADVEFFMSYYVNFITFCILETLM